MRYPGGRHPAWCIGSNMGGERKRGRPETSWEYDLEDFLKARGMRWDDCALDRGAWGNLEESSVQAVRLLVPAAWEEARDPLEHWRKRFVCIVGEA